MKSAILANAALCLCPPLVATSAVVTVPAARHAVHRLTAHHPIPHKASHGKRHAAAPCVRPEIAAAGAPSVPSLLSPTDEAPVTRLAALDLDRLASGPPASKPPQPGSLGSSTLLYPPGPGPILRPTGPVPPAQPVNPGPPLGAVPEPANWLTMLAGFLGIGLAIRRNKAKASQARAGLAVAAELGGATQMMLSHAAVAAGTPAGTIAARSLGGALIKKAALCVCSGAVMATAVTTVPPLKRAVYAATMPSHVAKQEDCRAK